MDDLIVGEWTANPYGGIEALAYIEAGMCPAGHTAHRVGDWMVCDLSFGAVFQLRRGDDGQPRLVYTTFLPREEWRRVSREHNDRKRRGEIPACDRDAGGGKGGNRWRK